jgi:ABC-2 type transport system permease protein
MRAKPSALPEPPAPAILFRGAGLDIVSPEFAWVAGIGAVLLTAAVLRFRMTLVEAQN